MKGSVRSYTQLFVWRYTYVQTELTDSQQLWLSQLGSEETPPHQEEKFLIAGTFFSLYCFHFNRLHAILRVVLSK